MMQYSEAMLNLLFKDIQEYYEFENGNLREFKTLPDRIEAHSKMLSDVYEINIQRVKNDYRNRRETWIDYLENHWKDFKSQGIPFTIDTFNKI
jgi:hypothetical protein